LKTTKKTNYITDYIDIKHHKQDNPNCLLAI